MARVTANEIKKMMEMEKDMTCVMDANNRLMTKSCEAMEKHNIISEKQMQVLEKHIEVVKENTETMRENTEVFKKYIELFGKKMEERKRSDRIRVPSNSSDIMEIPVPPPPPPPEPVTKKAKMEESNNTNFGWGQSVSNSVPVWQTPNEINRPKSVVIRSFTTMLPSATPNGSQSQNSMIAHRRARNLLQSFENVFNKASGCIYCSENNFKHSSEKCTVLKDSASRMSFMKMNGLCLTCADPSFRCPDANKCRYLLRRCSHCDGNHFNALCTVKYPPPNHFTF